MGDMFLKLGDLNGESQVKGFENQIQLLSWQWGMTQSGTMHHGSGGGAGRVNVQDLTFEHYLDAATPSLIAACCTGTHFPEATLTVRKAGGSALEYYVIKFTNVIVSSVSTEDGTDGELIKETVGLNFATFEITYQPQDQKGAKKGGAIVKQYDIAGDSRNYFPPPQAPAIVNGEAQLEETYKKGNEAFDYAIFASTTGRGNDEVLRHTVFGIEMSRVVLQPNGALDFRITRNRIGLNAAIRSGLQGCVPSPSDALKTFLRKTASGKHNKQHGDFDEVTEYIYREMMRNYDGNQVRFIRSFLSRPTTVPTAYSNWAALVGGGKIWDHKDPIRWGRTTGGQTPFMGTHAQWFARTSRIAGGYASPDKWFRFDVWSNIHYGFIGVSAGFSPDVLLDAAGVAQVRGGRTAKIEAVIRNHGFDGMYLSDDESDQSAIRLGIRLFNRYGGGLTLETFRKEVMNQPGFAQP